MIEYTSPRGFTTCRAITLPNRTTKDSFLLYLRAKSKKALSQFKIELYNFIQNIRTL